MLEVVQPCLLCDKPVWFKKSDWESLGEAPMAFCEDCMPLVDDGRVAWPLVKMIFLMRCQISHLLAEKEILKNNMKNLFDTQQELEQELLSKTK